MDHVLDDGKGLLEGSGAEKALGGGEAGVVTDGDRPYNPDVFHHGRAASEELLGREGQVWGSR